MFIAIVVFFLIFNSDKQKNFETTKRKKKTKRQAETDAENYELSRFSIFVEIELQYNFHYSL